MIFALFGSDHVLERLRQKAARAAAGVIHRLADLRVNHPHHRADDFARREELPAVVSLLAHLEQQPFIHLRQREHVRRVHGFGADLVDLVQHVQKVPLGVNARALDAGEDFADDLLARRGVRLLAQSFQVRNQLAIDETEERAERAVLQFLPLRPVGRGPILPAIRRVQRRREFRA